MCCGVPSQCVPAGIRSEEIDLHVQRLQYSALTSPLDKFSVENVMFPFCGKFCSSLSSPEVSFSVLTYGHSCSEVIKWKILKVNSL